jgi:hypothetical protein
MEDFSFTLVRENEGGSKPPLDETQENALKQLVRKARTSLAEKDYSTYWDAVFGIVASTGGSDGDDEDEDEAIARVNAKLGGPGA